MRPRLVILTTLTALLIVNQAEAQKNPPEGGGADATQRPQAIEQARTHFTRGTELYAEGSYELALIEFQRSYELSPSYMILYNLAQGSAQIGSFAQALRYFERYLADGADQVPAKRRAEVVKEIAFLKARTAQIEIEVNVPGAEVAVDDVSVGVAPFAEPLLVNAGKRVIAVTKPGHVAARKTLTLAGGDQLKVTFELPESAPSRGPVIVRPVERTIVQGPSEEKTPSYIWLGWATTGALTAAAVVTGVITLTKHNDYQKLKESEITQEQLDDASSQLQTFALATDILVGSAIVAGGVTLVLSLTAGSKKKKPPTTGSSTIANVRLDVAPRGVFVAGQF
jgi:tetratricopeptide (TPR) repeat protein